MTNAATLTPFAAATLAPLSEAEQNPQAGQARREKIAAALNFAKGASVVLAVKSAAVATAAWAGAPAAATVIVGALAVAAATGSMDYLAQRKVLRAAGQTVPKFSFADWGKSVFKSKAARIAGGMTALGALAPVGVVIAAGAAIAGGGEYFTVRRKLREAGQPVPPHSVRGFFKALWSSKSACWGVGLGALGALGMSAYADMASSGQSPFAGVGDRITNMFNSANAQAVSQAPTIPLDGAAVGDVSKAATPIIPMDGTESVGAKPSPVAQPGLVDSRSLVPETSQSSASPSAKAHAGYQVWPGKTTYMGEALPGAPEAMSSTDETGKKTVVYTSGVRGTFTPLDADGNPIKLTATQNTAAAGAPATPTATVAPTPTPPAAPSATVQPTPPIKVAGVCDVFETRASLEIRCAVDPRAAMEPGTDIEFRAVDGGDKMHVGLGDGSGRMTKGDFIAQQGVPEAEKAYWNHVSVTGRSGFSPK